MLAKTLLACAAVVATAVAQSTGGRIRFTNSSSSVTAGQSTKITWEGGNGRPVTITLRKGDERDLKTVAIITGDAEGFSYNWTPSRSLANGDDYALQIQQGNEEDNYTGAFTLTGGGSSSASRSLTAAATATEESSATATAKASSSARVTGTNATGSLTSKPSATLAGTGAVGSGASAATGTTLLRNTTMSRPTLSKTSSASASETGDSSASSTSSGSAPTNSSGASIVSAASNFALFCAAVAGVVYLG